MATLVSQVITANIHHHTFEGTIVHKQIPTNSPRRRAANLTVAAAALAACTLAAATPSLAVTPDITIHGGAQRNTSSHLEDIKASIVDGPAKNVILLIGDGMGDSEITAARNSVYGAAGQFHGIDTLPLARQYTTYALNKETGGPDYVTDSAASGTGWATGTKSYNVSTAELQDATPAVQVASVSSRSCYGPVSTSKSCPENALENGGKGSITEQMLDTRPDVSLGGGSATFAETAKAGAWTGKTLAEQATARGYNTVSTASELAAVTSANAETPVLGLFAKGNMAVRWEGALATHTGGSEAPIKCTDNPDRTADHAHAHSSQIIYPGTTTPGPDPQPDHGGRGNHDHGLWYRRGRRLPGTHWNAAAHRHLRSRCRQRSWPERPDGPVLHGGQDACPGPGGGSTHGDAVGQPDDERCTQCDGVHLTHRGNAVVHPDAHPA